MAEQGIQTTQPTEAAIVPSKQHPLLDLIDQRRSVIECLCPSFLPFDKIKRLFGLAMLQNPGIANCTARSVIEAVTRCARLGLDPSLPNMAHFVPYGQELKLIPGYAGLMDLAMRTGDVSHFDVRAVYEGDKFSVTLGTKPEIVHGVDLTADRTARPTFYYAIAWLRDGSTKFEVMSADEVELGRTQSRSGNSPAWKNTYSEMGKKTPLRRMLKTMQLSPEMGEAVEALDEVEGYAQEPSRALRAHQAHAAIDQGDEPAPTYGIGDARAEPPADWQPGDEPSK